MLPRTAGASPRDGWQSLPVLTIQPRRRLLDPDLKAVWRYRELLYFLVWRELKVRYRQTLLGAAWAMLQPFLTMVVFTMVFGHFAAVPSDGLPYPIFAYTALVAWAYFSQALLRAGASVVGDANLIRKVYFPRVILPIAAVLSPLVDFAAALVVLLAMMAWFGIAPGSSLLALPVFLLLAMLTALAVGLWLAALNVRYRDVGHAIPFLANLWLYASPLAYPVSLVPERWRLLYSLNPMAGVIEGFRWALLGNAAPDVGVIATSASAVIVLLAGGLLFFARVERTFADVA